MNIEIVPERLISPKTDFNLLFKYSLIFFNLVIIKKIYKEKKIEIKIDNQFNIIFIEKIFIVGSNEENKFIIF